MRKLSNGITTVILFLSVLLMGCDNKTSQNTGSEEDSLSWLENEFLEPDIYFESALDHFEKGDKTATAEDIGEAIDHLNTLVFEKDTVYNYLIHDAVLDLELLTEALTEGNPLQEEDLYDVFVHVDTSIARYHLHVVKAFYWTGGDKQEGLERLYRALVRIEYSMNYHDFELSPEDEERLNKLREQIQGAKKSSPSLWQQVDELIADLNPETNRQ